MIVLRNPTAFSKYGNSCKSCVLTLGNFDGLHIGHQKILIKLKSKASQLKLPVVLISFYPHPLEFIKGVKIKNLTTFQEKYSLLTENSVDCIYLYRFNNTLRNQSASSFLEELLKNFNPKYILVGSDAKVGANRTGDVSFMQSFFKKNQCDFDVIDYKLNDLGNKISSSEIRALIESANVSEVKQYLGREYSVIANVLKGDQRGREIGFRTANIKSLNKLFPPNGVYITSTKLENKIYNSVTNIGLRPTFNKKEVVCETHLLNYNNSEFYGKKIEVFFKDFIRAEMKFSGVEELKIQIQKDCKQAKRWHEQNN